MKGKRKKACSMAKYWVILVCWFFFPLVLSKGFGVPFSDFALLPFLLVYWLFVIAAAKYKDFAARCYLEKHYPYETRQVKKSCLPSAYPPRIYLGMSLWDRLRRIPPPEDQEWREIEADLNHFMVYIGVSFGAVGAFPILYGILQLAK